ncbi:shiftless antiviral inhibitor of ribosomal frameshifting protein [Bufo gargarizans]|uniref:shiftless antiviral inhibitor of ribosomal frameshifting protein n=1 Tax=Bufo gargarizans TaxID=30331 RepID=UPI001CF4254E|nr:shiftless antiviral inhibitor of ribosomal frameshifting protein [Bufo gargarizans]
MEDGLAEELELEKSIRRLREKFHGKIPIEKAMSLMKKWANNHDQVTNLILLCRHETNDVDQGNRNRSTEGNATPENMRSDREIKNLAETLNCLPLTEENLRMFNNASENRIPSSDRQFSCKDCDKMWWRRVPTRKEVSKCHSCRRKFDPIPHDKMWGIAEFHCLNCRRTFKGFSQMGLSCPCYMCGNPVTPTRILPPRRNNGPRTRNPHSCFAENCYNRREPYIPGHECVHPRSRARNNCPKVLYASMLHLSTGSTVATCLSQGSLTQCDLDDLILDDIRESDEDGSDSNDS